jgi:hypothetical protein
LGEVRLALVSGLVERDIRGGLGAFDLLTALALPVPEPVLAKVEREVDADAIVRFLETLSGKYQGHPL